ncbi:MFS-type efflux pump MSMEG_3705 [Bacillus rossius redtenbacheri]|uniref:MFS-type efflux pump MSMEG_3705 n=1 Tax=Bacillus rossius redtenbacheri TaxID=93214 RepID=UPI002FDD8783
MRALMEKARFLYKPYVLAVVSLSYMVAEVGHFLIGVTSKATATDIHYGDISCQLNNTELTAAEIPVRCDNATSPETCANLTLNGSSYCEWTYNGLGIDYQILAGPSFIAVYTVMGVVLGVLADRYNRVRSLAICTFIFSIAILLSGAVQSYWQLVILRLLLAVGEAGCNPMATGLLSDIFPENKRGLVLSIFNWGIYGGYGIDFPIGRYIPKLDLWGLGWRVCYYGAGIAGFIVMLLLAFTVREPERKAIGEESARAGGDQTPSQTRAPADWRVLLQPRVVALCLAASIRHTGGLCFAYNCDLYYQNYFPTEDLGWWLFIVTFGIGSIGVIVGGVISDKFVARMGIKSRVAVLALSQLIATPGAFGSVYADPLWAMITLAISYFFAEMWFGIVFAVLVEIIPLSMRSTTIGVFLFVMNNIGGNLPILVDPVSKALSFRESLYIFYVGAYLLSSVMFLGTVFLMDPAPASKEKSAETGFDNAAFSMERIASGQNVAERSKH